MSLRSCFRCNTPFSEFVVENTCPNCGYVSKDRDTASTFNTFAEYESNFQLGPLDSNLTADIQLPSTILVQPKFTRFVPLTPDVPNHTDFELIGSGGMGLVYRAIQRPVDRLVAVKVMNQFNSDQLMLDRFVNEVKAHARINHPFIVPIYEVGQCSQGPYFTMEYLPGGTLADRIKSGRLDLRTAVKIVADAAEGVHSAHCSGVIHRDIKPSNILVDKHDNVKVTDFGLAKHADGVDLTNTGMVVGTFSYMSPEQASGVAASITKLSDVYCLGATLFHAITGDVVHSRAAKFEMLDNIQTNPTPNIDRLPHGLCPTLRAVLLKSLAAMPSDRYESALAFANDLRAWLEGLPTIAQPPTGLQRVATWASRHRVELVASMTGLILLAAIAVGILAADPKRLMERRLARGESVELIGESGVPKWYRWECTPATLGVSDRDSSCCFQTTSMTALVLVDDPQAESYRFTAEIRHDNSRNKNGTVGLHVGPRVCPPPRGVGHVSFRLTFQFNDYWNTVEQKQPELRERHGLDMLEYVNIQHDGQTSIPTINTRPSHRFTPEFALKPHEWRAIRLEVSHEGIKIYWRNKQNVWELAFTILPEELAANVTAFNRTGRDKFWPGHDLEVPQWNPRTAIGIFAKDSVVSFRNVVIEPLPSPFPERNSK